MLSTRAWPRAHTAALSVFALIFTLLVVLPSSAQAAISPPAQRASENVTADALPTVQIDGIVWGQALVGKTVYAGGKFDNARPAGAAPGTNLTPRANLLAYDLESGELKTDFAPSLNGQVLTVAASPDGSRIYVGGDFTEANGQLRRRIAAYSTSTGQLISSFAPPMNFQVRAIVATDDVVYVGGTFEGVGNQTRRNLAAFDANSGALLDWAPEANRPVWALALSEDESTIIAGGHFETINGVAARGLAKIDASTGAVQPWPVVVSNAGADAAVTSLSIKDGWVYGTTYHFGAGGNLEGPFKLNLETGETGWVADSHGDTYSQHVASNALYFVGHPHYVGNYSMGFPQYPNWRFQHSMAVTLEATGENIRETWGYANWDGTPSPSIVHWFPTMGAGNKSGATQAAWSVTGNDEYIVMGGEFPRVNRVDQEGLVRFAVKPIAPELRGPTFNDGTLIPTFTPVGPGSLNVSWMAGFDMDDRELNYQVVRTPGGVVANFDAASNWWTVPGLNYVDEGLTPGATYSYQIRVTDASGNRIFGSTRQATAPTDDPVTGYGRSVLADDPMLYWPMDDASGSTQFADLAGGNRGVKGSSTGLGAAGAIPGNSAATFNNSNNARVVTTGSLESPDEYTVEAWFRSSAASGPIVGFGDLPTGNSQRVDRQLYLNNSGRVHFGIQSGGVKVVASSKTYNNNQWHHAVGTVKGTTARLYVDGVLVGKRDDITRPEQFVGHWRVGGDRQNGFPNAGAANFNGAIDEVAVYTQALSGDQIEAHYVASGRTSTRAPRPTDNYGAAVYDKEPTLYWRLNEASGSQAADFGPMGNAGTYRGGYTRGVAPAITGDSRAITVNGNNGYVSSDAQFTNPQVFSTEAWFRTTTNQGGKIIGFGNQNSSLSSSYDRHVYMLNDGRLRFGVYPGGEQTVTSPNAYNDGTWHQVVSTLSGEGMRLYVDGSLVASNDNVTSAEAYNGYWRFGGDRVWSGANSNYFAGSLDEVAVYSDALTAEEVQQHFLVGKNISPPVANFDTTSNHLGVTVDASDSTDPSGDIVSYEWDFGDDTSGTGASTTHTYAESGTYIIVLKVTSSSGASHSVSHEVTVTANEAPAAAFSASTNGLLASLDATESEDSDGTIAGYAWDFGDGSHGTGVTTSHTYDEGGTYEVTLTVTDDDGATDSITKDVTVAAAPPNQAPTAAAEHTIEHLLVTVDGTSSTDPDGTIVGFAWDFGDGNGANTAEATHTYAEAGTYEVTLTVTDDDGATDSTSFEVIVEAPPVNQAPTARFEATLSELSVSVDAAGSTDADGTIDSYTWTFGDGATGTGVTASHTYEEAGTYTVTLTVKDNDGAIDSTTESVTVTAPPPNEAPTAAFSWTAAGLTATLDGSASTDADGMVTSYEWEFGDGTAAGSGAHATHTYASAGTYDVKLTVTDNAGDMDSVTHEVTVTAVPPDNEAPTADFTVATQDLVAQLDASSSDDPDGTITSYQWDLGDGNSASGMTVSHTYEAPGTYDVTLTVVDDGGASAVKTQEVTVSAAPGTQAFALDTFARSATNGFGVADHGGAWTPLTGASAFSVGDGTGNMLMARAGSGPAIALSGVDERDVRLTVDLAMDKVTTGSGVYNTVFVRRAGSNDYRLKVWTMPSGTYLLLARSVNGAETVIGNQFLPIVYSPGQVVRVSFAAEGNGTTTLSGKAWVVGNPEPAWQIQATDGTAALQASGSIGLQSYLSGSSTNAPVVSSWDNLTAQAAGAPAANLPPVAAFTITSSELMIELDGSTSSDIDGTIADYHWDFGDGTSGSGVSATHTFAAAGTYTVKLTVTDDKGASGDVIRTVTVSEVEDPVELVADNFQREVAQGFGTADQGGVWTVQSRPTSFSVVNGQGRIAMPAGAGPRVALSEVEALDTEAILDIGLDKAPEGSGVYVTMGGRQAGSNDYRAKLWLRPDSTYIVLARQVGGVETAIASAVVPGLDYEPGKVVRMKFQIAGEGTTTLRAKAWLVGDPEPSSWTVVGTDSTAQLQAPGAFSLQTYLSGSVPNAPVVALVDGLRVNRLVE